MSAGSDLGRCLAYIGCHLTPAAQHGDRQAQAHARPSITLSRQTGSGAMEIARRLAEFLHTEAPGPCGWAVFDKNLVAKMLEEHDLPQQIAQFLPEDHISRIRDTVEELLGLHPPSETLIRQISETVVHLAGLGHVILVGRATNVITQGMANVFHVRIVAPVEKRVNQVMTVSRQSREAALEFIRKEDAARRRYLKDYFRCDPDDALGYDLVLNTGRFEAQAAAHLIGEAFLAWSRRAPGK